MTARAFLRALEVFAEYLGKGDVELQALAVFLMVAERGRDFAMQELQDALGMGQSSVSRNTTLLSIGWPGAEKRPELIETFADPDNYRRKLVRLTPRGRALFSKIENALLVRQVA